MTAPPYPHSVAIGRPHLGPRTVVTAAMWSALEEAVDVARGSLDRSPYLADLLAWSVGRPELIRHNQLAIEFFAGNRAAVEVFGPADMRTRHRTVRVHPDVAGELDRGAIEKGLPRSVFIADTIAQSLGVRRATSAAKEEGLPLAM